MESPTRYNISEIYDPRISFSIIFISELISSLAILFSILFLMIVIKKTPKSMKQFKFYIIQYACFAMLYELVYTLTPFTIFHPYLIISPNGISKFFNPKILFPIYFFGAMCAICILDCSIAIIFERYYALIGSTSNKPYNLYIFLLISNGVIYIFGSVCLCIQPFRDIVLIPQNEVSSYLNNLIPGLEGIVQIDTLIVINNPIYLLFYAFYVFFRVGLASFGIYLNAKQSHHMSLLQNQLSSQNQKANEILRQIIYIQSFGYFFLLSLPGCVLFASFFFIPYPSNIPNYCFRILFSFGLYDPVFTIIFIKPYRNAIFYPLNILRKNLYKKPTVTVSFIK